MLDHFHILCLSIIQGLTEFLPVSSSGHLILLSKYAQFPDQGLVLDVAVHFGSILAVIMYFSPTLLSMMKSLWKAKFFPDMQDGGVKLFWLLVVGTLPIIVVGSILHGIGIEVLRSTKLIGWTIVSYAILLFIIDKWSMTIRQIRHMGFIDALLIGIAQCLALVPGTSRSGITITMARFLGLERSEAAKFSMLLSIPSIIGATVLVLWQVVSENNVSEIRNVLDGTIFSYITSIFAIYAVMWWLKKWTFLPFVIYRIVLGTFLLLDSYGYINKWLD